MKITKVIFLAFFVLFSFVSYANPVIIEGKVISVYDGDTLAILTREGEKRKVRLADIDAPERKQPWGDKAREALSKMCLNVTAKVKILDKDFYGRIIGKVYCNGVYANMEMVKNGHVWAYREYLRDERFLIEEIEARKGKKGLWSLPEEERIAPWKWRENSRKK